MKFIFGMVFVMACVLGAYAYHGGHLYVLWQPAEFVIIIGAAVGSVVIGSPPSVLKQMGFAFKVLLSGLPFQKKPVWMELMGFFFELSKLMRTKGIKEVEQHIDHPHDSDLFKRYPTFYNDHHLQAFVCDNVRLIVMGSGMPNQLDELMDEELRVHHAERANVSGLFQTMADGMPALGIVAAVLGVIHTMGSITEPPEILGKLIGAALVGTFCGVLLAYGFVGPMGKSLESSFSAEHAYYICVKVAIVNFARQLAPQLIAEFARKHMPHDVRPSFKDSEEYLNGIAGGGKKEG